MSGNEYVEHLKRTLEGIVANLRARGIQERHLAFGGEGTFPTRKPSVSTDARSEFLANRAMGDWAERRLAEAMARACPEWKISHYGETNRIAAGHPNFRGMYLPGWNKFAVLASDLTFWFFPQQ